MARKDGYKIALGNRVEVLKWLHRFGGLTTRQLARLHWPKRPGGMRMAQRTVHDLLPREDRRTPGYVLRRRLPSGGCIYVLAERGAQFLRDLGVRNVSARGHRDLSFDKPTHRMIANDVAIDCHLTGREIWTEFEIQRRRAPTPNLRVGGRLKIPDLLVREDDSLVWVEVENAPKPRARLDELVLVAKHILDENGGLTVRHTDRREFYFHSMKFIATDPLRLLAVARRFDVAERSGKIDWDILKSIDMVLVRSTDQHLWGGESGAVAMDFFLDQVRYALGIKAVVQSAYEASPRPPEQMTVEELFRHYAQLYEAMELDLTELSDALDTQINDHDALHHHLPPEITGRLHRDVMLRSFEKARTTCCSPEIGFTKEFLHTVMHRYKETMIERPATDPE